MILDGRRLASQRGALLQPRVTNVRRQLGRPPRLLLLAFGDSNRVVPHLQRKLNACASSGIDAVSLIMPPGVDAPHATEALNNQLMERPFDGVFIQFPFPTGVDGEALAAAVPVEFDVDIMTPARTARFLSHESDLPPVTVAASLLLLDAHMISIAGRRGVVVAPASPFALMFREALIFRGARMDAVVDPDAADLRDRVRSAELVIAAAGSPGLLRSADLARNVAAIDVGYFNPGGRGDIDLAGGIEHLEAIAPVPGGIGPMTVQALLERVVLFAEAKL